MAQTTCSCEFTEQMISHMLEMRRNHPGDETKWVDLLYSEKAASGECPKCCLMTFLLYYGYCHECTESLSERARTLLAPLMAREQ